ncbi:glycosyltransferase family 61 protein [Paracoccus fontiphilus]|uniref:Glycosyltransferase family 61 protein n=1 Tax=Paracoccus fontiphilus TaxID=1815556 RepID=A0ABV7IF18_9RHOB|nr:glycosyltransferase family 61 protein [Paracoccus fontiphilus]
MGLEPKRIFLARRKQRAISNQAQIEALLHPLGYSTVYPEDLPISDQFRLFNTAEQIVAVHGAGLAPLLYRHLESPLRYLVEILPCGHMTDFFRLMAQQVGCSWIGVRGRLKPEYIQCSYKRQGIFNQYSLDSFEVDPVSLERAIKQISINSASYG